MANMKLFPDQFKQNDKLAIRMVAPGFGHLSQDALQRLGRSHRKAYYFFLFMIDGTARHTIDLETFEINDNDLLFILPNQMHELPTERKESDYFKLGFDESCLAML